MRNELRILFSSSLLYIVDDENAFVKGMPEKTVVKTQVPGEILHSRDFLMVAQYALGR